MKQYLKPGDIIVTDDLKYFMLVNFKDFFALVNLKNGNRWSDDLIPRICEHVPLDTVKQYYCNLNISKIITLDKFVNIFKKSENQYKSLPHSTKYSIKELKQVIAYALLKIDDDNISLSILNDIIAKNVYNYLEEKSCKK